MLPTGRARLPVDHRLCCGRIVVAPESVDGEPCGALEALDRTSGGRPELAVDRSGVEPEPVQELLQALHVGAARPELEMDERDRQGAGTRAGSPRDRAVDREHVRRRLDRVQRRVVGRVRVPPCGAAGRDHAHRSDSVPGGEPDAHVGLGPRRRLGTAVVRAENLLPGLTVEGPTVGAPLTEATTVSVADTAHLERDDLVVTGGCGVGRCGADEQHERRHHQHHHQHHHRHHHRHHRRHHARRRSGHQPGRRRSRSVLRGTHGRAPYRLVTHL